MKDYNIERLENEVKSNKFTKAFLQWKKTQVKEDDKEAQEKMEANVQMQIDSTDKNIESLQSQIKQFQDFCETDEYKKLKI